LDFGNPIDCAVVGDCTPADNLQSPRLDEAVALAVSPHASLPAATAPQSTDNTTPAQLNEVTSCSVEARKPFRRWGKTPEITEMWRFVEDVRTLVSVDDPAMHKTVTQIPLLFNMTECAAFRMFVVD
jgi:hypothetical protein